ncbi:MAG: serine--tRNA ligase, partial [Planctomycetes bacterium]|nr:serine--tRNA ligase [Planctomycetota bacterium]
MIDLRRLRDNPQRFKDGCASKGVSVDIDRLLALDEQRRTLRHEQQEARAGQNALAKEVGPRIGTLTGRLKKAHGQERAGFEAEIAQLKSAPAALKDRIRELDQRLGSIEPEFNALLLAVPLPPDPDVPVGKTSDDNVELSRWNPDWFDTAKSFRENKGFDPRSHMELARNLGLVDLERGVRLAGSRSYLLVGDGARLHQAILRYAMDFVAERGFTQITVPVLVREEAMVGTGFFPAGREQAYMIDESVRVDADVVETSDDSSESYPTKSDSSESCPTLFLTGTGEVSLMGMYAGEILDEADLPLKLCTVSTCFRREAGAGGKDTAGLYRIHQFDKVEQVVICRADEGESRRWHREMIGIVEQFVRSLELPHRLLQCCTGDLGVKNADMIDLESWMPSRGPAGEDGLPRGAYGETHSASRLYDFQCRRLDLRCRPGGEQGRGETTFCHSLNNTVAASPRLMIPILEMYQNKDGSITVPGVLRPYMSGCE